VSDGKVIRLPYLHDHHSHVSLYAALEGCPSLESLDGAGAFSLLKSLPRDRLSLVTGWHTDRLCLGAGDLKDLPPAIVINSSLHGFAITPSGKPLAAALWPELGERADDPVWAESNIGKTFAFYVRVAGLDAPKLEAFMSKMAALGICSLDDMTIAGEEAAKLVSTPPFSDRIVPWATPEIYKELSPESKSRCVGIKIYLDGSLGSRSASIDAPFLDGSAGSLLYSDDGLKRLIAEIAGFGLGMSAHALGHRCTEQVLRCLEELARDGLRLPSVRLEHLQFIDLGQARRCKAAGFVLSMQPNFNADSAAFADRLIPRHLAENDPFRMLIDQAGFVPGEDLVFGSDGMPHDPGFALRWSLFPAYEGQRLSLEEFAAGYEPRTGRAKALEGEGSAFALDLAGRDLRRVDRQGKR
jgi:hypothetical protein